MFEGLQAQWRKAIPSLNCQGHDVFCFVDMGCNQIKDKVQSVGFVLSGYVFEIPASEYLFVSSP